MRQTPKDRCAGPGPSVGAIVAVVLTGIATGTASAEELVWRVTPRATVEQAYNSNVNLSPKGQEQSDFITSLSPGLGVRGTGRRLSLNFDYDPEQVIFLHNSDRNEVRQRFRGLTNIELLEQLLFFEASGSANQQFTNNTGAIGGTTLTASRNLQTVQTYSFGPVLRNHLGTFADTETRYTYSIFKVDGDNIADTTSNQISFIASSGRDFTQLGWTFTANASESERSGGTGTFDGSTTERRLAKLDTQYALNSTFSLLGGAGYERVDDPTLNDPPDGAIWDAGFQVKPNSVSTMRFTAGERFGGANYNASLDYLFNPRTRLHGAYLQQINTSQGLAVQNLNNLSVTPSGLLIDSETGRPFLPGDPQFGITNAAFRQDRLSIGFEHSTLRNRYNIDVFDEQREFDTTIQNNSHSRGVTLGFNRSLTPLLSLNVGGSYSISQFENQADREDDFYSVTSGLSYQLSDTVDARLTYRHTSRKSSAPNADIIEDFVAVTLLKEF
jgi:uncharacterized protein (PEP-CTERM system associated)